LLGKKKREKGEGLKGEGNREKVGGVIVIISWNYISDCELTLAVLIGNYTYMNLL